MFSLQAAKDRCGDVSRAFKPMIVLAGLWASTIVEPATAAPVLQCVTYARTLSGIALHGDAGTWWDQAANRFDRSARPQVGAVLAFRATSAMPHGHVAVVDAIVDDRHILLDHANWSAPGLVEQHVLAEDTSAAGDWSSVRVWYAPSNALGSRQSPTFGFIYAAHADSGEPPAVLAQATRDEVIERAAG